MKKNTERIFVFALSLVLTWLSVTNFAWQINNPKANSVTFWTHFSEAILFEKVAEFQ